MKRKIIALLTAAALSLTALPSVSAEEVSEYSQEEGAIAERENDSATASMARAAESAASTTIKMTNSGIKITGEGATATENVLTISQAGTYTISGSHKDARIVVNADKEADVYIILSGLTLTCTTHAPLYVKQAGELYLTLAEGTENTLKDSAGAYTLAEDDDNVDAVIFSKEDLTIDGTGSLHVVAAYKHAIVSKDDLKIKSGTFTITAPNGGGLHGKDSVTIKDGSYTITSGSDAIQADNDSDEAKGYVSITGGSLTIASDADGVQAETDLSIKDATIKITTAGGSANAPERQNNGPGGGWGQQQAEETEEEDTASTKGLKAGNSVIIESGKLTIDAYDDGIHSNNDIVISGGTFTIASGDDAIHADSNVSVEGGTINITKCYEGIEGQSVDIKGGDIAIVASDDGLNAAGGTDGSGGRGGFRVDENAYITINGGNLNITADYDGIDSNGNLTLAGGVIYVSGANNQGDSALDYDGTALITGGTLIAAGGPGMRSSFGGESSQPYILYGINGAAGTEVTVKDASGNVLASYTAAKVFSLLTISSAEFKDGSTYTVQVGDATESVTLSGIANTIGDVSSNNNGPGGGFGGGQRPEGGGGGQRPEARWSAAARCHGK